MEEGRDERIERGRLGRLFAALVGNEDALEEGISSAADGSPDGSPDAPHANEAANVSLLDLEALSKSLMGSPNPVGTLRTFAADVRRRAEQGGPDSPDLAPSAFELYLATRLTEAGIDDKDVRLPALNVVRPRTSNLFYLRVVDDSLPWRTVVALLRIEAALNCALLIEHALEDPNGSSLEEIVRCEQRVFRSIISQATDAVQRADSPALGEWAIRSALSGGIERMRLPYRLTARFRVNAALGTAAIEVDLVPPQAWSSSVYVDGLGVVSATAQMRRRAASDYNLRLGVLLARYALMVAPQLREVWVAGVIDTARDHACYFSARLTRSLLDQVDLDGHVDPYALMQGAGAAISAEARELDPVRQTFSLDDERFCPAARYEPVEVSERTLLPSAAEALGCTSVAELGIDEACRRKLVSTELTRSLGASTEKNVRALLDVQGDGAPPDVREAALRCVNALVEGTLEDDPLAIAEALVSGDELTQETERARALLYAQDMPGAEKHAILAIKAADEAGRYDNGDGTVWHAFGSYTERVLYNLLVAPPHEKCGLVSESYLEAQLIASAAALVQERSDDAVRRAERACEIAPLSSQASLHLAQCLEASGRDQEAFEELCRLLSLAHDPESIGFGYLRMSQLQWREGHVLAAQACYQRACRTLPGAALVAGLAVVALLGQVGTASQGRLSEDAERSALAGEGIPVAPTHEVGEALLAAARAAVDAGIFWVARDLVRTLCSLFRDDVTFGILRSLEDEPDR